MFGWFHWTAHGILVAALLAVYSGMAVNKKLEIAGVQRAEMSACNARIAEMARETDVAIKLAADEARAAADMIERTPEEVAELQALCNRSASCRSRTKGD